MIREKIVKFAYSFLRPHAFGLDISDASFKFLAFRKDKTTSLEAFGEVAIPEGVVVNGEIQNEAELIRVFQAWLKKEGKQFRSASVVASLPEEKSFLRVIQLSHVQRKDIGNAIRWDIEANIPLAPEDILYDHEIIERETELDHFDVVITAFPKTIIASYVRVLKEAGLTPLVLELESQSIVRSLLPLVGGNEVRIVVDIGRGRTTVIIFSGAAILYTNTIILGGKTFEENIMKGLQVSQEKALLLKKQYGLDKKQYDGALFQALVPSIDAIADELKRTTAYYQAHTGHTHGASELISGILLVGGDANLLGLDTYLASMLKIPVLVDSPMEMRMHTTPFAAVLPILPRRASLAYATAIGLALRGIPDG